MSSVKMRSSKGVAVVTLAQPANRNALTGDEMLEDLLDAIHDSETDPEVGVLVVDAALQA